MKKKKPGVGGGGGALVREYVLMKKNDRLLRSIQCNLPTTATHGTAKKWLL